MLSKVEDSIGLDSVEEGSEQPVDDNAITKSPRQDMPTWRWVMTLMGICFGTLLYGNLFSQSCPFPPPSLFIHMSGRN